VQLLDIAGTWYLVGQGQHPRNGRIVPSFTRNHFKKRVSAGILCHEKTLQGVPQTSLPQLFGLRKNCGSQKNVKKMVKDGSVSGAKTGLGRSVCRSKP
jgi:hypothetical protein